MKEYKLQIVMSFIFNCDRKRGVESLMEISMRGCVLAGNGELQRTKVFSGRSRRNKALQTARRLLTYVDSDVEKMKIFRNEIEIHVLYEDEVFDPNPGNNGISNGSGSS